MPIPKFDELFNDVLEFLSQEERQKLYKALSLDRLSDIFSYSDDATKYFKEMEIRKCLKYPPFYYLCYVKISGKDMDYISKEANKIKRAFERNLKCSTILGPTPSTIFRVNNIYRYGIILKYKKEDNLYKVLEMVLDHYKGNARIRVDVDFNPSQIY